MDIMNIGNKPTFQNAIREEVLDISLASRAIWTDIIGWKVLEEVSMSDHNLIEFRIGGESTIERWGRNPRKTNWIGYREELNAKIGGFPSSYGTTEDLDHCCEYLTDMIRTAYENNCRLTRRATTKGAPWWNQSLAKLRKKVNRLLNRVKRTKSERDDRLYRAARREYKTEIERAKIEGWRGECSSMRGISDTARLCRILQNPKGPLADTIRLGEGWAENAGEALEGLLQAHFPDFRVETETEDGSYFAKGCDWHIARHITEKERVEWAIGTFEPYKAAGPDGIFPALLQQGEEVIVPALVKLFRACLANGYTPNRWRKAKVVFLPKPGRTQHTTTGDFRPISLSSFLLKTIERLVDRYVKDECLEKIPLHSGQHAYQTGKSVDTALAEGVGFIERGIRNKGMVLVALLDVDGAFNHTTREAIAQGMTEHGISGTIFKWIWNMLSNRVVEACWGGTTRKGRVGKGCPQGGVLSPTLWCLVVDGLIRLLNEAGVYAQAYADDIMIMVRGDDEDVLTGVMRYALGLVENWCRSVKLSVNPGKVKVMLCTTRYKVRPVEGLQLNGAPLNLVKEAKYLGVIIDSKLNWGPHIKDKCRKAICTFWMCRRAIGRTWGLGPDQVRWIYEAIIKPRLKHGAIVWGHKCELKTHAQALERVQRLVMGGIAGSMRTTPTVALEILLGLPPLDKDIRAAAFITGSRLMELGTGKQFMDRNLSAEIMPHRAEAVSDKMTEKISFSKSYKVITPAREEWREGSHHLLRAGVVWFTDGSKTDEGVGAGAWERGSTQEIVCSLDSYATVFQAEVRAIKECAERMISTGIGNRTISICSDSRAALQALEATSVTSKEVMGCRKALEALSRRNVVRVMWVPGHAGVRGNEKADRLAGMGSRGLRAKHCQVGMPECELKAAVKRWLGTELKRKWVRAAGMRQAKQLLGEDPPERWTDAIGILDRARLRLTVGWLTGHWGVGYHLYKMGLRDTSKCRWCGSREETTLHLLCKCPAFVGTRHRAWGRPFMEPGELRTLNLSSVLGVMQAINKRL